MPDKTSLFKEQNDSPTVLITGAARRIGADLARCFHREGYNIAAHYNHSAQEAENLAEELNHSRADSCRTYRADLNDLRAVTQLGADVLQDWQHCHLLINNASSFYPTPIGTIDEQQWDDLIGSNLKAPLFLSQALAPSLIANRGCIINITDINADKPFAQHTAYCIAKAGNNMLTRSLAKELAPHVRVNGIAPGAILWPEDENKNPVKKPEALEHIPLQRLGGTANITATARFIVLESDYITGQIIAVDGGKALV